jgi:hypothetical protein
MKKLIYSSCLLFLLGCGETEIKTTEPKMGAGTSEDQRIKRIGSENSKESPNSTIKNDK